MKKIRVEDAVGHVLCHDMTRIVKGEMKGPQFKKGHIVTEDDIPMLLDMGKKHLYVWEASIGMLHENDAAERIAALSLNLNMNRSEVSEGKIELSAAEDGFFRIDTEKLYEINAIDGLVISCRHNNSPVKKGDKLAGTRITPLVIPEDNIKEAEKIAGGTPVLELLPYILKSAWIITTGSEVASGRIKDTFTPVIIEKLRAYGIDAVNHTVAGDDPSEVENAIAAARRSKPDLILCTGGMSVDPDDNTPGAIKRSGAEIVTYGAPVLPGAMFLLGYYDDGTPIMGLPGCVMYAKATIFDIALPRIAAGLRMSKRDFVIMGNGGLCLNCPECKYPVCPFGKA